MYSLQISFFQDRVLAYPARVRIVETRDLAEGAVKKFEFHRHNRPVEGFVTRFQGQIVAYENVCCHVPISLDYGDNRFYSRDGQYFVCQTHGAVYEPLTGLCVRGPCTGERLKPLPIEIRDGAVWLLENPAQPETKMPSSTSRTGRRPRTG